MKIYLCASYARKATMALWAAELREIGHEIASTWHYRPERMSDNGIGIMCSKAEACEMALRDSLELLDADCLITLTEPMDTLYARGGRHAEFGMAVAAGKRLIVVGHRENVFHFLPQVEFFDSWIVCRAALAMGVAA